MFRDRGIECSVNAQVDWISFAVSLDYSFSLRVVPAAGVVVHNQLSATECCHKRLGKEKAT